jgi:hypothetical protein
MKRTPLKTRSAKRIREDRVRAKVKADRYALHPICEVPWCAHPSEDIHEPLTRARGGSITDPENVRAVCRMHHDLIHLEPDWAHEYGFLRHSWDGK